ACHFCSMAVKSYFMCDLLLLIIWLLLNAFAKRGILLALRAGENGNQRWLVHCTPHFLFFFQKKKRKRAVHGPKEKKKYRPCGGTKDEGRARRASSGYASLQPAA
ncbi:hypothetical protein, partial [uncultured Oscillibacter sp.]|uniref:hypothetical protein n=1 Tax=uncultured Oscillibacter sp. TaxID=876091 RepID=UPI00261454C2